MTLDRVLLLIFNTSSKLRLYTRSTPLWVIQRRCPILLNLIGITNTNLHRHRHRQPHCPPWNPIQMLRFLSLGISTWEHNNGHRPLCDKCSECRRGTPGVLDVCSPLIESYQCHQHQHPQHQLSSHSHDPHQRHLYPASYPHQHPETSNCAQMPIETLYSNLLTTRLDDCIGLCMSVCVIGISWWFVLFGL